jgi:hypothetical protein
MQRPDLLAKLKSAVEGLTYPSESDEPFDVVCWENPKNAPLQQLVTQRAGSDRPVKTVAVDEFFAQLQGSDDAKRFHLLRRTIQAIARGVQVFRSGEGEVRVDVYLIGYANTDQSVVGVHTVSVET